MVMFYMKTDVFNSSDIVFMIIYAGMTKNVNFVKEVSSHFRSDAEIIVVSVQSLLDFHLLGLHSVLYSRA